MWFEKLTGFKEESPHNVREKLEIDGDTFVSSINKRRLTFGKLEIPTLDSLRQISPSKEDFNGKIQVSEIVANVQDLHCDSKNLNALFQAASQFNLLEMVGPSVTPEQGIDRYEKDFTQGPACAIACGAGTIFRNYFVEIGKQTGQTVKTQIDCLAGLTKELQNDRFNLWTMKNGYALMDEEGLLAISQKLISISDEQRENLKDKLKVGIQWETEVTISESKQTVSQIYCSALPVAYCPAHSSYWEHFARLILEATYEATLFTALINMKKNNSNVVYLTLVGGGAFGNKIDWILDSISMALNKFRNVPLDVRIVSYGKSNPEVLKCINEL